MQWWDMPPHLAGCTVPAECQPLAKRVRRHSRTIRATQKALVKSHQVRKGWPRAFMAPHSKFEWLKWLYVKDQRGVNSKLGRVHVIHVKTCKSPPPGCPQSFETLQSLDLPFRPCPRKKVPCSRMKDPPPQASMRAPKTCFGSRGSRQEWLVRVSMELPEDKRKGNNGFSENPNNCSPIFYPSILS